MKRWRKVNGAAGGAELAGARRDATAPLAALLPRLRQQ